MGESTEKIPISVESLIELISDQVVRRSIVEFRREIPFDEHEESIRSMRQTLDGDNSNGLIQRVDAQGRKLDTIVHQVKGIGWKIVLAVVVAVVLDRSVSHFLLGLF